MTQTIRFPIAGMTCTSCVNRITRSLKKVDRVRRVKVDFGRETATVTWDGPLPRSAISSAVAEAGYAADLELAVEVGDEQTRGLLERMLGR